MSALTEISFVVLYRKSSGKPMSYICYLSYRILLVLSTQTMLGAKTHAVQGPVYFSSTAMCAQSKIDVTYSTSVNLKSGIVLVGYYKLLPACVCTVSCSRTYQNYHYSNPDFVLYVFFASL